MFVAHYKDVICGHKWANPEHFCALRHCVEEEGNDLTEEAKAMSLAIKIGNPSIAHCVGVGAQTGNLSEIIWERGRPTRKKRPRPPRSQVNLAFCCELSAVGVS